MREVNDTRMIGTHIKEYRDWEAAAKASMAGMAISRDMLTVVVPPMHGEKPMKLKAHLCVEFKGGRMSWRFHSANGLNVDYLPKPRSADIDRVDWWRAW